MSKSAKVVLADVLAVEGEKPDAIQDGVHVALANSEQIFKAAEVAADFLHLIAAAAWVGGLLPLAMMLTAAGKASSFGPL